MVAPKNLGLTGLRDSDTTSLTEGVTSYSVRYWPKGSSSTVSARRVPYPQVLLGRIRGRSGDARGRVGPIDPLARRDDRQVPPLDASPCSMVASVLTDPSGRK
jgi:hypothetical protein